MFPPQDPQQVELAGGQDHRLAVFRELAQIEVHAVGAEAVGGVVLGLCFGLLAGAPRGLASQHGADTGEQLPRIEGFGQVVVRADLQPDDAIDVVPAGREHADRDLGARAQTPGDAQAVFTRQHQVEDDEIGLVLGEPVIHRGPVWYAGDVETLPCEIVREQGAQ